MADAFSPFGLNLFGEPADQQTGSGTLADRFIMPPFSVFMTDTDRWQKRKRAWLSHGIQSEIGRDEGLAFTHNGSIALQDGHTVVDSGLTGTSVFDAVLCELAYAWWCPAGGRVIDPFAGGSVRGIVASLMGYRYTGVELRPEQVAANVKQGKTITPDNPPSWIVGDSSDIQHLALGSYDFMFTCPPYGDLERYSDDPRDLSTMSYETFILSMRTILARTFDMLKDDSFAAIVVGDFRDRRGNYHGFPADVMSIAHDCGMGYYNHAIIVNSIGTIRITAANTFRTRKLSKRHQDFMVFVKGDGKKAAAKIREQA